MIGDDVIEKCELLSGMDKDDSQKLFAIAQTSTHPDGETIFRLGANADSLFVVVEGRVDLTFPLRVLGELREVRLQSLGAGRVVGWSALVPPHKLTMSGKAATKTVLLGFSRAALEDFLRHSPSIGHAVMSNLSKVIGTRLQEAQALWLREVQRNVTETHR